MSVPENVDCARLGQSKMTDTVANIALSSHGWVDARFMQWKQPVAIAASSLWLIPLPGGGGVDANRVTEASRTVDDEKFYQRFFDAVGKELYSLEKERLTQS